MRRTALIRSTPFVAALVLAAFAPLAAANDGVVLRAQVVATYPSLLYVDRYRARFPAEVQGTKVFWSSNAPPPDIAGAVGLVRALAALEDQHVALVGPRAGKSETLGVLFRTATDGATIVWRVFDSDVSGVRAGDRVVDVAGVPAKRWLERAAELTFGGNRRGRFAEAATDLGLATPIVHRTAGLGEAVSLRVQTGAAAARTVRLPYRPMDERRAIALTTALGRSDLPRTFASRGYRIGTLRIGAFAPQYDATFIAAADRASRKAGTSDEQAMLAGYCAVTASLIERFDAIARTTRVVVIDVRGNLGGFDREARLETSAIAASAPPRTFDLFATGKRGIVRLAQEPVDPSCGHVADRRPLVVLDDAATRSSGEFMTAWLWSAGSAVVGEQTVGAGGGFEYGAGGFALPGSGFRVRTSGNLSIVDPALDLSEGEWAESVVIGKVTSDGFSPSRSRPFAFQSVGVRPDVAVATSLSDLRDGGLSEVESAIARLRSRHILN